MQLSNELTEFGKILIFMLLGISFILLGYAVNYLIKKPNPNPIKNDTYECGEVNETESRVPFNMRFYIVAIMFLLFDVELVFLFPWSTIFADKTLLTNIPQWGTFNLLEMFIFIALLLLGLAYIWKKGDLEWMRPQVIIPTSNTKIPSTLYQELNRREYSIKQFELIENNKVEESSVASAEVKAPTTVRRPPFRSVAVKKENNE